MNLARAAAVLLLGIAPLAHAASPFDGFWMKVNDDKSLDPGSQVEYKVDKQHVTMNTPAGATYKARIDGADAPMANHPNITSVSVRIDGRVMVETAKSGGKPAMVTTIEVQPDGKSATVTWKNPRTNASGSYVMSKQ